MLTGEIKIGDELLFDSGSNKAVTIRVVNILSFFGEQVILISINGEKPIHVSEELLRTSCQRING